MLAVGVLIGLLTPVRVYPDSINYLISGDSFFSGSFAHDYFWLREPLYPAFLRLVVELPAPVALHLIPALQGLSLAAAFWLFAQTARQLGLLGRPETAAYYAFTCLLVTGYSGAVLQQTFVVLAAGALAYCAVRLATTPLSRLLLIASSLVGASAILLSSIFLPSVALLPFSAWVADTKRRGWAPLAAIWGSGVLAIGAWTTVRFLNGQPLGLGGAAVLDRAHATDWPLRLQAFLATFGLAPDFYDGVTFNVLSYSNIALGLNPYFGGASCVSSDLVNLRVMPDSYLMCGSTLGPTLSPGLLQPLTTFVLIQVVIGVVALIWAWSATSRRGLYAFVLVLTMIPCLPVAFFLADGNSRYGLPVLALSLVATAGMASRAFSALRRGGASGGLRRQIV